jgi:hypothetical protein
LFIDGRMLNKSGYINIAVRRSVIGALATIVKKVLLFIDFGVIPGVGLGDRKFEKKTPI